MNAEKVNSLTLEPFYGEKNIENEFEQQSVLSDFEADVCVICNPKCETKLL